MGGAPKAKDIDAYITAAPRESRAALQLLRRRIQAAAPRAAETIAYQMPAFRLDGRLLVSFAAFKNHCSLFPMSLAATGANAAALKGWDVEAGTIRFQPNRPIPAAAVKKIVKARIAENALLPRRR